MLSSIDKGRLMLSLQACNRHPVGSSGLSKIHTRRSQTVSSMIFTHLTVCVCLRVCACVLRVMIRDDSANINEGICMCVCTRVSLQSFLVIPFSHMCLNEGVCVCHKRSAQR